MTHAPPHTASFIPVFHCVVQSSDGDIDDVVEPVTEDDADAVDGGSEDAEEGEEEEEQEEEDEEDDDCEDEEDGEDEEEEEEEAEEEEEEEEDVREVATPSLPASAAPVAAPPEAHPDMYLDKSFTDIAAAMDDAAPLVSTRERAPVSARRLEIESAAVWPVSPLPAAPQHLDGVGDAPSPLSHAFTKNVITSATPRSPAVPSPYDESMSPRRGIDLQVRPRSSSIHPAPWLTPAWLLLALHLSIQHLG